MSLSVCLNTLDDVILTKVEWVWLVIEIILGRGGGMLQLLSN